MFPSVWRRWSGPSAPRDLVGVGAPIGDCVFWRRQILRLSPSSGDRCDLAGDESEFSREFDGRIRERFPIGSSEGKLLTLVANEGFFPDWRSRDNPNASFFVQSGLICQKIVRVFWRTDVAGTLTDVRGSYESRCI